MVNYSHNTTVEGMLCYALDLLAFERDCFLKQSQQVDWIVISPFDYVNTNDLLTNAPDFNIEAVVIQYD